MALSVDAQAVVDDHNNLSDSDEVDSLEAIILNNITDTMRWETFKRVLKQASENQIQNLVDYLKADDATTMIFKKPNGKIIHPDPTRPSGQA